MFPDVAPQLQSALWEERMGFVGKGKIVGRLSADDAKRFQDASSAEKMAAIDVELRYERPRRVVGEDEDEVRNVLGQWANDALSAARSVKQREHPEQPEEKRDWVVAAHEEIAQIIPLLVLMANRGDVWATAKHALRVGMLQGHMQAFPNEYHANRKLRLADTLLGKSRKTKEAQRQAGADTRKAPDNEELARRVTEMYNRNHPHLSWTECCRRIGIECEPEISRETVRVRAKKGGAPNPNRKTR